MYVILLYKSLYDNTIITMEQRIHWERDFESIAESLIYINSKSPFMYLHNWKENESGEGYDDCITIEKRKRFDKEPGFAITHELVGVRLVK